LDGVLTKTAAVHAAAWKEMFDSYLSRRARGQSFVPFDIHADYDRYVDGKTRVDGTRSFLESRRIALKEGSPEDRPGTETIRGLSNWKNEILLRLLREDGVEVYEGSIRYLRRVRALGLATAVVSSSANCLAVLTAAGIADMFDARMDGVVIEQQHLRGKPAPDAYLAAARSLDVTPGLGAVFEDALAGVAAGRSGGFGCVVGVDRANQADALKANGADLVVADLAELLDR
jgi:beta-phosphoglucomutase family hydrolase